jgi:hypothetical protein
VRHEIAANDSVAKLPSVVKMSYVRLPPSKRVQTHHNISIQFLIRNLRIADMELQHEMEPVTTEDSEIRHR